MLGHVNVQMRLLNTLRIAECALARSLVSMKHLVFFHDTLGDKTLSTVGATIFYVMGAWLAVHCGHVVSEVGRLA